MSHADEQRRYRELHPDRARAACRAHHQANREVILERKRLHYQAVRKFADATPEGRFRDREKKARRRAQAAGERVTSAEWLAICAAHGGACAYCGDASAPLEMDHVIPLSKGGRHAADNIVPACKPCNSAKGAR